MREERSVGDQSTETKPKQQEEDDAHTISNQKDDDSRIGSLTTGGMMKTVCDVSTLLPFSNGFFFLIDSGVTLCV